jgi:hypothetical protein
MLNGGLIGVSLNNESVDSLTWYVGKQLPTSLLPAQVICIERTAKSDTTIPNGPGSNV